MGQRNRLNDEQVFDEKLQRLVDAPDDARTDLIVLMTAQRLLDVDVMTTEDLCRLKGRLGKARMSLERRKSRSDAARNAYGTVATLASLCDLLAEMVSGRTCRLCGRRIKRASAFYRVDVEPPVRTLGGFGSEPPESYNACARCGSRLLRRKDTPGTTVTAGHS